MSGDEGQLQGYLARLMRNMKFTPGGSGPGEMGKPVHIEPEKEEEMKEMFKLNQVSRFHLPLLLLDRPVVLTTPPSSSTSWPRTGSPSTARSPTSA